MVAPDWSDQIDRSRAGVLSVLTNLRRSGERKRRRRAAPTGPASLRFPDSHVFLLFAPSVYYVYCHSIICQPHWLAEKIGREEKEEKCCPDRSCLSLILANGRRDLLACRQPRVFMISDSLNPTP